MDGGAVILHPGFPGSERQEAYWPDLIGLAQSGVFTVMTYTEGDIRFDIAAFGLQTYAEVRRSEQEPIRAIGRDVKDYLDQSGFASRHRTAYERWKKAADILWSDHPEGHLSEIGHHCREAMQEFAETLAQGLPVLEETSKTKTVDRVRAALNNSRGRLGETVADMLDALAVYWGTVSDLAQRQEHAAGREGESLGWEDARRLVFHTALVMYELDRTLNK
jgi:hypothetical protein